MMMEIAPIPMMGDTSHMADAIRRVFVVRDGSELLMSSEPVSLDDALKIMDGGKGKMLTDSEAYEMLDGMVPVESADVTAVLLTKNFADEMKAVVGPMMGMATPIIQSAFGDIAGYGFWMKAASEGNLVEYGTNIGMNGDAVGLMKLVSLAKPMSDIPRLCLGRGRHLRSNRLRFQESRPHDPADHRIAPRRSGGADPANDPDVCTDDAGVPRDDGS